MANSRKSKLSPRPSKRIAVALSGGLDSVVLLDTVCKAAKDEADCHTEVWVFHIHHGLQKPADAWLAFCERLAKKYHAQFDFRLLHFAPEDKGNIEARARASRYDALAELCAEHGIDRLLLAHHQNDQAETVLLQLLRGAGVAGLSGMPESRILIHEKKEISLWRPLLNHSRTQLEAYAKKHRLKWVEDPSNQDTRYRRNAIRKQIIPRLEKIQPEALTNLARSAQLLAQSQTLLDRLARQDGKSILAKGGLMVSRMLALSQTDFAAANNLLRYWLRRNGLAMPSQERLDSWWKDVSGLKAGARLQWLHDEVKIGVWQDRLQILPTESGYWGFTLLAPRSKQWGLSASWVDEARAQGRIHEKPRTGSEKIQIKPNSPRKTLKNLFQEAQVPPWERQAPLLYIDDALVAVAGVGVSYPHLQSSGARVMPQWLVK